MRFASVNVLPSFSFTVHLSLAEDVGAAGRATPTAAKTSTPSTTDTATTSALPLERRADLPYLMPRSPPPPPPAGTLPAAVALCWNRLQASLTPRGRSRPRVRPCCGGSRRRRRRP